MTDTSNGKAGNGQGGNGNHGSNPPPRLAGGEQANKPGEWIGVGGSNSTGAGGRAPGSPFNHPAPEGHAKKVSEVLGEIVWLMSQSRTLGALPLRYLSAVHKQFFMQDLEWPVACHATGLSGVRRTTKERA